MRRLTAADVLTMMEAINAIRSKLWTRRGADQLGPIPFMDLDETIAPTARQCKAGMDISYMEFEAMLS